MPGIMALPQIVQAGAGGSSTCKRLYYEEVEKIRGDHFFDGHADCFRWRRGPS